MKPPRLTPDLIAQLERTWAHQSNGYVLTMTETTDTHYVLLLNQIRNWATRLAKAAPLHFRVETDAQSTLRIRSNALGEAFLKLLRMDLFGITKHFPCHKLAPEVELVLASIAQHGLAGPSLQQCVLNEWTIAHQVATLNACAAKIRLALKQKRFASKVQQHRKQYTKRCTEIKQYFNRFLAIQPQAQLHQLELLYSQSHHPLMATDGTQHEYSLQHWRALESSLPGFFSDHLLGYVWQLDYSALLGYRFFVTFLLTPDQLHTPATLATVKQHWCTKITGGNGLCVDDTYPHLQFTQYRCATAHQGWPVPVGEQIPKVAIFYSKPNELLNFAIQGSTPKTFGYG